MGRNTDPREKTDTGDLLFGFSYTTRETTIIRISPKGPLTSSTLSIRLKTFLNDSFNPIYF